MGITRRRFLQSSAGALAASALPWSARAAADPFVRLDATAQAALVAKGEVTPLELVDAAIARIEALNGELGAFVATCFDRAREQAQGTLPDGPFRGVPYAIKDLSNYEGVPTTFGSKLFEDFVPDENGSIVESALAAGVVVLGKTNTPEFGLISTTESDLLGPARNPWNLAHHTAGSSGGAAAAVASGMLPFAQASDGGGSIRLPATACGVFGLKPSRGRIRENGEPLPGDIAVRFTVSRSVRDSARLLTVSQNDGPDAPLPPAPMVSGPGKERLKIALMIDRPDGVKPHAEVAKAVGEAAKLCEGLGHTVVEATPPVDTEEFLYHFFTIWSSMAEQLDANAWLIGLSQWRLVRARDVLEPWTLGLAEMHRARPDGAMQEAVDYCARITREYQAFFDDYDVLLHPVAGAPAVAIGEQAPGQPFDPLLERVVDYAGYTAQHNAAGTPSMSVPLGMSADGLPIGSQFAAGIGREERLLALAYELEQAAPWADRWAPHSAVNL